jgi:alcohol dehydrogenase class IV
MTGYFVAPRVAWGPGAIEELSGLGFRRAFVLVDPAVARKDGHRRVLEELAKGDALVDAVPLGDHPIRTDSVEALAARITTGSPDVVVAVGGGATIDAAKAARLLYENPGLSLESLPPVLETASPPRSRLLAIPTTSGSGSDASWSADLFAPDGSPVEIAHRSLVPDWAIVDAQFALSLSPAQLLDGALETATQAVEAYLSAWSNPFSDALALDALATVVRRLPHALRWSDDPDARSALHYAATAAGLAASNAQRGVAHALARALVPTTGLSYGRLVGILLPFAAEFAHTSARDRLEALAAAAAGADEGGRLPVAVRLRRLYELLRFPLDLEGAGIPASVIAGDRDVIVARALRSPAVLANPRVPSARELGSLLDSLVKLPRAPGRQGTPSNGPGR